MVSRREEVYKVESIGEREGPCGVPLRIEKGVDLWAPTLREACRSGRKDL